MHRPHASRRLLTVTHTAAASTTWRDSRVVETTQDMAVALRANKSLSWDHEINPY